ncbi:MAG TPA: DNA mismatch repair endonuclease MutL [Blastocatellia bacterium]|nr:DNA mismatch repair endonuclease MutL [Blastocatellia bacterium]
MSKIRVLPDTLANKIAAGEVVERPSSVVKELLENSLDASARKVNIEVEAGGKRLIRVLDDGEGMVRDDAITAFERHATSKLRTADDLEAITTLGFRGEALPSIASVSRLFLRTKTERDQEGTEVEFSGGRLMAVRDIAWPGGTELEVKDLFFNIPARRKFLKSDATESFHITNLVQHYALANPHIAFLLVNNGREAIRVAPARSLRERAYQVLGGGLLSKMVEVAHEADGCRVAGFVSNPQEQRSSRDAQYLFVNRRFVRDQLLSRALSEAYRSMMPSGVYPAAILFIDIPPAEVDVNVHPAKTEVRFLREAYVLAFVRTAIIEALKSTAPVAQLPGVARTETAARPEDARVAAPEIERAAPERTIEAPRPAFNSGIRITESGSLALSSPPGPAGVERQESLDITFKQEVTKDPVSSTSYEVLDTGSEASVEIRQEAETPLPGLGHGIKPLGQIRDSYIVATDEEGLLLVDQHAAHERVLFEQFRDTRLARPADVQPLLIPETMELTLAEAEAFRVVQEELESIGIETMQLSGRTIAVKTAPAGLLASDVIALVRHVLDVVERERRSFTLEHIRDEIAATLACKAAIKVNFPLTEEKMQWLIDELMKTQNSMTCPHGRPIIVRFGLRDIERGFKRPV